jgi:hypothetical protein
LWHKKSAKNKDKQQDCPKKAGRPCRRELPGRT